MLIKVARRAGVPLDQQHDNGVVWTEDIMNFWPEYLESPDVGVISKGPFAAPGVIEDGYKMANLNLYPIDSPANTLASSMYFLLNADCFEHDDLMKIAYQLKESRDQFEVSIPGEFLDHVHGIHDPHDEIYVDHDQNLPVTTPEQAYQTIEFFNKNASHWPSHERIHYASSLQKVASAYDLDIEIPYASNHSNPDFMNFIEKRADFVEPFLKSASEVDRETFGPYMDGLMTIIEMYEEAETKDDYIKVAQELHELDVEFGVNQIWGKMVPDPADSLILTEIEKVASPWDEVDWDGLKEVLEPGIVDEISADPDTIIPSLPSAHQRLVNDYVGKTK